MRVVTMSMLAASVAFLIAVVTADQAHAQYHAGDVQLTLPVPGGPIVTGGGDWTGDYAGRVFEDAFAVSPPYDVESPGFDALAGTFTPGSQIRFDFVKELLFWNGTALAVPNVGMTLDYQGARSATITGGDTGGAPGFLISSVPSNGSFHVHIDFALPNDAAAGLYGIVLALGPHGSTTGFTASDPFLVTFEAGTPTSLADYDAGMEALVAAAFVPVPEPAAGALGMIAAIALAAGCLRRPHRAA